MTYPSEDKQGKTQIKGSKEPTHRSAWQEITVNTEVEQKTRKLAVAQVDFIFSYLHQKPRMSQFSQRYNWLLMEKFISV